MTAGGRKLGFHLRWCCKIFGLARFSPRLFLGFSRPGPLFNWLFCSSDHCRQSRPPTVMLSSTGSFKSYVLNNLYQARSQLHQRRFLRLRRNFSGFLKIYVMIFIFQISTIFQNFCTIFTKFQCNFARFRHSITTDFSDFHQHLRKFYQKFTKNFKGADNIDEFSKIQGCR